MSYLIQTIQRILQYPPRIPTQLSGRNKVKGYEQKSKNGHPEKSWQHIVYFYSTAATNIEMQCRLCY